MKFSQRIGKTSTAKLVQHESIDTDLMNSLWSALTIVYFDNVKFDSYSHDKLKNCNLNVLINILWLDYFKKPIDEIPASFSAVLKIIKDHFFKSSWHEQFDFLEAFAKNGTDSDKGDLIFLCNQYLKRENSAYRFVNGELSEITSEIEIKSVEQASNMAGTYAGVKEHISTSLELMNDRDKPDYRNSIKESISAVESLAKVLSGKHNATLGQALRTIEKKGDLHPALKAAFSSLYGYTNDSGGIRHALLDESTLTKSDAKFMLIICSAFVNYLIEHEDE